MKPLKNYLWLSVLCYLGFTTVAFAQFKVSGQVLDDSKAPLPGASIMIKNTTNGAISDINGNYSIEIKDSVKTILVIKYIGFLTQEIQVNNQHNINIVLQADNQRLDEVVVVSGLASGKSIRKKNKRNKKSAQSLGFIPATTNKPTKPINSNYFEDNSSESYAEIQENQFKMVSMNPLSTFSIDVDKGSYANVRRYLNMGQMPPADAVRIEEMINYFDYEYPNAKSRHPYEIHTEVSDCPWNTQHKLMMVGLQGKQLDRSQIPPSNLVFLLDVSGSMSDFNKLPLLKKSFPFLLENLTERDRVSIVVYAGAAGVVLPPTSASNKKKIMDALNALQAGGSTAGGQGIELAYKLAEENFIKDGNNRVILATDGDFNVGVSNTSDLKKIIEKKRETGIYLTCLGFGMGNYKDDNVEGLANAGNGNYAYIDNVQEAQKVLGKEFAGTIYTIAKDVKLQLEFNPAHVQAYRLIGYENRLLNEEDFDDDQKDAGEMGAGHTVTALYEVIPTGVKSKYLKEESDLKYQKQNLSNEGITSGEWATVKSRYKHPKENKSEKFEVAINYQGKNIRKTDDRYRFASSVALFGMLLRESKFTEEGKYEMVIDLANNAKGEDKDGYKAEFVRLVKSVEKGLTENK